jgi:glutathione S-transferase
MRFLAADRPTIADIACFPYVALAPDGGVTLDAYPAIRLWSRALRALDRFIEMPGIHRLHELKPEPHLEPGEA